MTKSNNPYAVKTTGKGAEIDGRTITAIANTYNYIDSDDDVLLPGCCKRSIKNRGAKSEAHDKILYALGHDLSKLPGKSLNEFETIHNGFPVLMTESKLLEDQLGEEVLIRYKEGIYNQHSIGFGYVKGGIRYIPKEDKDFEALQKQVSNPEEMQAKKGVYEISEINLFEWSTVAFGANKLTPFLGVKTDNKEIHLQTIYAKLDIIIAQSKKGAKNRNILELEYKQLKQMLKEFSELETKPTPPVPQVTVSDDKPSILYFLT